MDKIKKLLQKAGCKEELVDRICESLVKYKTTVKEQLEADYEAKLKEAKKICVEETEAHKRELARRLQIFCETKAAAIEASLAKRTVMSESKAESTLNQIQELVGGVKNGKASGDVSAVVNKANARIRAVLNERRKAVETANKYIAIANRVMKANRQLLAENAELKKNVLEESKQPKPKKSKAQPKTTRRAIVESVASSKVATKQHTVADGDKQIIDIANQIDD